MPEKDYRTCSECDGLSDLGATQCEHCESLFEETSQENGVCAKKKDRLDLTAVGWCVVVVTFTTALSSGMLVAYSLKSGGAHTKAAAGAAFFVILFLSLILYFLSRAILGAFGIAIDTSKLTTLQALSYMWTHRK